MRRVLVFYVDFLGSILGVPYVPPSTARSHSLVQSQEQPMSITECGHKEFGV